MKNPVSALGRFHARNVRYFDQCRDRAAHTNLRQLRAASVVFLLFLAVYGIFTRILFHSELLSLCYVVFSGLGFLFLPFAFLYGRDKAPSPRLVQAVCMLFILLVMGFTVAVSVLPFPDDPGIFYPLAYMLMTVLFILPYWHTALLLSGITAAYLLLVFWYKDFFAIRYDIFAGVTTWALGFFFLYVVTDLRLRDGERLVELEHLSRTDTLTGLPNRRIVEGEMARAYRRCQRSGQWAAAMMLDVDDFKLYNDLLGHLAGDVCLHALGNVMRTFADEQGIYAARYGGEEFLFFLPDCTEEAARLAAEELLERIRALALPFTGHECVTVSIGLAAELPGPDGSYETLLRRADEALYQAKDTGKDCATLWAAEP